MHTDVAAHNLVLLMPGENWFCWEQSSTVLLRQLRLLKVWQFCKREKKRTRQTITLRKQRCWLTLSLSLWGFYYFLLRMYYTSEKVYPIVQLISNCRWKKKHWLLSSQYNPLCLGKILLKKQSPRRDPKVSLAQSNILEWYKIHANTGKLQGIQRDCSFHLHSGLHFFLPSVMTLRDGCAHILLGVLSSSFQIQQQIPDIDRPQLLVPKRISNDELSYYGVVVVLGLQASGSLPGLPSPEPKVAPVSAA